MSERAIGSGKWKKLRITILDRDGWQCAICNRPAHTVDHIIPRVKGGDMWAPDNLQSMCKSCNSAKVVVFLASRRPPPAFPSNISPRTTSTVLAGPCTGQPEQD